MVNDKQAPVSAKTKSNQENSEKEEKIDFTITCTGYLPAAFPVINTAPNKIGVG